MLLASVVRRYSQLFNSKDERMDRSVIFSVHNNLLTQEHFSETSAPRRIFISPNPETDMKRNAELSWQGRNRKTSLVALLTPLLHTTTPHLSTIQIWLLLGSIMACRWASTLVRPMFIFTPQRVRRWPSWNELIPRSTNSASSQRKGLGVGRFSIGHTLR